MQVAGCGQPCGTGADDDYVNGWLVSNDEREFYL
jgi:hypothetical protein